MSKYTDIVKEDTPRLIIKFRVDPEGREQYEWGVKGQIPIVNLIGAIVKSSKELSEISLQNLYLLDHVCEEQALILVWVNKEFEWFVHPDKPLYGILGMLCLIRSMFEDSMKAQQVVQKSALFGPDGKPIDRRLYN